MKDMKKYGADVLDKCWDILDAARTSYIDHDGRFPGEKLRKLARYAMKVAGKVDKARVVGETHHWIAGDGTTWFARNCCGGIWLTDDCRMAYRCGSEMEARGLIDSDEVKRLIETLVKPKKFRAWLLNEKVEVSPCRS